jgi:hypothetical protein
MLLAPTRASRRRAVAQVVQRHGLRRRNSWLKAREQGDGAYAITVVSLSVVVAMRGEDLAAGYRPLEN